MFPWLTESLIHSRKKKKYIYIFIFMSLGVPYYTFLLIFSVSNIEFINKMIFKI